VIPAEADRSHCTTQKRPGAIRQSGLPQISTGGSGDQPRTMVAEPNCGAERQCLRPISGPTEIYGFLKAVDQSIWSGSRRGSHGISKAFRAIRWRCLPTWRTWGRIPRGRDSIKNRNENPTAFYGASCRRHPQGAWRDKRCRRTLLEPSHQSPGHCGQVLLKRSNRPRGDRYILSCSEEAGEGTSAAAETWRRPSAKPAADQCHRRCKAFCAGPVYDRACGQPCQAAFSIA
jgi:hypothetical protein